MEWIFILDFSGTTIELIILLITIVHVVRSVVTTSYVKLIWLSYKILILSLNVICVMYLRVLYISVDLR